MRLLRNDGGWLSADRHGRLEGRQSRTDLDRVEGELLRRELDGRWGLDDGRFAGNNCTVTISGHWMSSPRHAAFECARIVSPT